MNICGIELKGSEARLAVINIDGNNISHVDVATKKIPLIDGDCSHQVSSFKDTIESFFREHEIENVFIKKRNKKGEYAGGPDTFKMEGVIQISSAPNVVLVSPQTISAMQKKATIIFPQSLNKYQQIAFLTGLAGVQ